MKLIKLNIKLENQEEQSKVSKLLNQETKISKWKLDKNILNVTTEDLSPDNIIRILENGGYDVELIQLIGVSGVDL